MLSAQLEFDRREAEINEFLSHLELLETQVGLSVTLINTMKSSSLLMMYNLVESTMTNLMQDIFDDLRASDIAFDSLNREMKTVVLSHAKKRNPAAIVERMSSMSTNLVVACFDRSNVFAGNIDCKRIVDTLRELGISTRHRYSEPAFATIRDERNYLAHGHKSFSDCGRDYAASELRVYYEKIKVVLHRVITDFERFLAARAYS
jgi:hypothetical protein